MKVYCLAPTRTYLEQEPLDRRLTRLMARPLQGEDALQRSRESALPAGGRPEKREQRG